MKAMRRGSATRTHPNSGDLRSLFICYYLFIINYAVTMCEGRGYPFKLTESVEYVEYAFNAARVNINCLARINCLSHLAGLQNYLLCNLMAIVKLISCVKSESGKIVYYKVMRSTNSIL